MNAYQRIQAGKRYNEQWVLQQVRKVTKEGKRWEPRAGLTSTRIYNACDRLVAKGRIRWVRSRSFGNSGYVVVK